MMRSCGGAETKAPEPSFSAAPVTVQPTVPSMDETPTPVVLTTPEPVEINLWTTDNVNLRSTPSASAEIKEIIPKSTKILRLEYPAGNWVKVRHDDIEGYVSTDYVSDQAPVTTTTPPAETTAATAAPQEESFAVTPCSDVVYTTTDGINFRRGPGTEYDVAGSLDKNVRLERTGTTANGWSRVLYNSVGYFISSAFLSTEAPETEEEGSAESPTPTAASVSTLNGEFQTDTGVALNMIVRWTATPAANGSFELAVSAALLSDTLTADQFADSLCFNIGGNTYYKTAPAIAVTEANTETPLGSQSVTVPAGHVPLSVSWSFNGSYSGKSIDKLSAETNLNLQ